MKKTMIFAGMLSIGYAYAQRGNVGINTASPNSTLEVKVADVNSNNDTNQGVLIPKLSKTRVAAIADGKLVKGTLVFVEGITYSGTNAKVVDINADGFYYYNGTKWAKVEGSVLPSGNANGQVLKWNGSAWIASADDNTNIYTNDGTLPTNRTVNLDQKFLNFENGITEIKGGSNITNPLRISSGHSNGASMIIHPNNTSNQIILKATPTGDASLSTYQGNGYVFIQKSSNNIGINTTNPSAKLHVAGNARIETIPTGEATDQVVTADNNGNLRKLPLSSIDTNTTYTAGNGLTLTGTEFSLPVNTSGTGNVVTGVTQTANGITVTKANVVDTNTTYTAGNGLTLSGTEFSLPVNTSGTGNVVTGITQTANGITVTKGDVNFTDTNTNIYNNDGTLSTTRNVNLAGNNLNFNSGAVQVIGSNTWAPLRVSSTNTNGAYITLSHNNWDERIEFVNRDGNFGIINNGLTRFSIDKTSGNVAIGGETPTAKLDVVGNARIRTLPAGTATDQIVTADANGNLNKRPLANVMNDFSANFIINQATTTQSANFRISGTGQADTFQTITSGNAQGYARLNSGSSTATGWLAFYRGGNNTEKLGHIGSNNANMFYQAEGGRHHIFATTGNVGIGTENPTAKLDVAGTGRIQTIPAGTTTDQVVTADNNGNLRKLPISSIGGTTNIYTSNGTLSATRTVNMNGNNLMFTGTGNVGIGTNAPTAKLDVAGDIRTNAVIYNSDARLKKGVNKITNASAMVNKLNSVTYHWNEAGKKKGGNDELQYGFIAQEVEKVLPSLVTTDSEGYKSVNYVAVVPVLVKALQEKDDEVKKLQAEMEQMKKEVEQIKQLLKK